MDLRSESWNDDFWAQLIKDEVRSSEFKWRNKIKIMNDEFGIMNY